MRALFIGVLLALLGSVALVALVESDPGYVLIAYGQHTVETSIWVGMLLAVSLTLVLYYLFRFLRAVVQSKGNLSQWLENRRLERGRRLTARGALHFFRGEYTQARRVLLSSAAESPQPALNFLLAAESSSALGEVDQSEAHYLELEGGEHPDELAAAISRAKLLLANHQPARAAETLNALGSGASSNALVVQLLADAYQAADDWGGLTTLLPNLRKHGRNDSVDMAALAKRCSIGLLHNADSEEALAQAWAACADEQRRDSDVLAIYVERLLAFGADVPAEKLLLKALKKDWQPSLVRLYGLCAGADSAKQLQRAEGWLGQHANDAQLLLALGRLCLREKLWGKARDYFSSSHQQEASSEACAELARLLFRMGEREQSAQYYREGLLLVENSLPELPLPRQDLRAS